MPLPAVLQDVASAGFKRLHEILGEQGYGDVRPGHGCVFRFIDAEGSRLTQLAEMSGFTKQAVGEVVGDLEKLGYVERVPDPDDRRAKIIRLTDRGAHALDAGKRAFEQIEREWAELIGERDAKALREICMRLREALDAPLSVAA